MDCPSWWRVIIQTLTMAMQKKVYYHVCQAFDVGFNSRDVNLTYEQFLKVQLSGCGHFHQIPMQQQCCLVAETRQF